MHICASPEDVLSFLGPVFDGTSIPGQQLLQQGAQLERAEIKTPAVWTDKEGQQTKQPQHPFHYVGCLNLRGESMSMVSQGRLLQNNVLHD